MNSLRTKDGITDAEWIRGTVNEAQSDPVGMWRLVRAGREQFGLGGGPLEDFVRGFIYELLKAGAKSIVGDKSAAFGWAPVSSYGSDPAIAADSLVREWLESNVDPDENGVWFAFPAVWM